MPQSARRPLSPLPRWKLWSLPAPLVTALLAVESCAVLLIVGGLLLPPAGIDAGAQVRTLIVLVVACLAAELGRDAERARRRTLVFDLHVNMARFGGEEFVILMAVGPEGAEPGVRDSAQDAACSVADRIRRRVAALSVAVATADGPLSVARLSVSVGAAVCPPGGADLRELVHAADMALLDAKRDGRDRVRLSAVQAVQAVEAVQAVRATSAVAQAQSAPDASVVTASAAPLSPAP